MCFPLDNIYRVHICHPFAKGEHIILGVAYEVFIFYYYKRKFLLLINKFHFTISK
jgi:hypothetical protein